MRKQVFSGAQEHNGLVYIVHRQLGNTTIQGFTGISFQMARFIAQALDNGQQWLRRVSKWERERRVVIEDGQRR